MFCGRSTISSGKRGPVADDKHQLYGFFSLEEVFPCEQDCRSIAVIPFGGDIEQPVLIESIRRFEVCIDVVEGFPCVVICGVPDNGTRDFACSTELIKSNRSGSGCLNAFTAHTTRFIDNNRQDNSGVRQGRGRAFENAAVIHDQTGSIKLASRVVPGHGHTILVVFLLKQRLDPLCCNRSNLLNGIHCRIVQFPSRVTDLSYSLNSGANPPMGRTIIERHRFGL